MESVRVSQGRGVNGWIDKSIFILAMPNATITTTAKPWKENKAKYVDEMSVERRRQEDRQTGGWRGRWKEGVTLFAEIFANLCGAPAVGKGGTSAFPEPGGSRVAQAVATVASTANLASAAKVTWSDPAQSIFPIPNKVRVT